MRLAALATLIAALVLVPGCGSGSGTSREHSATLVLDFTPNAVHAGIYSAVRRGYDRAEGVRLRVVAPAASTDSLKLLETGRANFAILDIHDLALARERGQDIVGIAAIVQRPLGAVIAAPRVHSPRQLQGAPVGITGVPSDTAVLRSVVAGAGGDPRRISTVTIGFGAVAALLSHRVLAATAFWNDEGVTLQHRRPGFRIFRVDRYGAPSYPELVLCARRATLRSDPSIARAVVRALSRGYRFTLSNPRASLADLEATVPGLDRQLLGAKLAAVAPAFEGTDPRPGELHPSRLRAWAAWEVRFGIVRRMPDVAAAFDPDLSR